MDWLRTTVGDAPLWWLLVALLVPQALAVLLAWIKSVFDRGQIHLQERLPLYRALFNALHALHHAQVRSKHPFTKAEIQALHENFKNATPQRDELLLIGEPLANYAYNETVRWVDHRVKYHSPSESADNKVASRDLVMVAALMRMSLGIGTPLRGRLWATARIGWRRYDWKLHYAHCQAQTHSKTPDKSSKDQPGAAVEEA